MGTVVKTIRDGQGELYLFAYFSSICDLNF